jgi:predicted DNA-binding transcriptional regulator AlpA
MTKVARRHHLDRRIDQVLAAASVTLPITFNDDTLLATKQVAALLGVSTQWLDRGRKLGYGPPWIQLGPRTTRYRYGDVVKWLKQRGQVERVGVPRHTPHPKERASGLPIDHNLAMNAAPRATVSRGRK